MNPFKKHQKRIAAQSARMPAPMLAVMGGGVPTYRGIEYRRIQHAAHYLGGQGGHDLEQWDCPDGGRSLCTGDPLRPAPDVPSDAKYHSGYIAKDGTQRWLFVRRAPLTGTCPRCETEAT